MPWRPAHQAEYKFSREAIFIDTLKPAEHTKRLKTQIGCWPQFPMYRGLSLWRVRGWFCLGFFLWIGAAARAQDLRGSLLVTAEDTTGGRIAGAIVTLTQEKSEGKRTARADTRGEARFDALQPGGYRVTIEANGFEEKTARVVVAVSSQPTLILALAPQTVQQSVQVRDRGPSLASQPIETTSSEIKTEIAAEDLDEVPLSARSFANISLMAPFTAPVEPSDPTKARITAVSFGGSSGLNVDLSVDGGDNNDDYIGGFLQNFSPEAVQEFVVRTAQFGADTSRTNGGSVIISSTAACPISTGGKVLTRAMRWTIPSRIRSSRFRARMGWPRSAVRSSTANYGFFRPTNTSTKTPAWPTAPIPKRSSPRSGNSPAAA